MITWTPTKAQGPGTYTLTTIVMDSGTPSFGDTNSFDVVVNEINTAPVLPVPTNLLLTVLLPVAVTNTATDSDLPVNSLTYQLLAARQARPLTPMA